MMRGSLAVRSLPNVGLLRLISGHARGDATPLMALAQKFTWFAKLNASARNCSDWPSRIENDRVTPISKRTKPGPTIFREPAFPYVPNAGCRKAAGLIHP